MYVYIFKSSALWNPTSGKGKQQYSQNHCGWKRPLRSPTPIHPAIPIDHGPKCHISTWNTSRTVTPHSLCCLCPCLTALKKPFLISNPKYSELCWEEHCPQPFWLHNYRHIQFSSAISISYHHPAHVFNPTPPQHLPQQSCLIDIWGPRRGDRPAQACPSPTCCSRNAALQQSCPPRPGAPRTSPPLCSLSLCKRFWAVCCAIIAG